MNLLISKQEAEAILDMAEGGLTKVQRKYIDSVVNQIKDRLGHGKINPKGWTPGIVNGRVAPLRSAWPQNVTLKSRKSNPYYHKPRDKKPSTKQAKPTMTPQEILKELGL